MLAYTGSGGTPSVVNAGAGGTGQFSGAWSSPAQLDAFVNSDAELAEKVIFNDNVVDDLYEQIFRELLTYMLEDPRSISRAIKLIFIAKHLERVGDHSANIAEMVIFLVRGQDIRHGTRLDRGR